MNKHKFKILILSELLDVQTLSIQERGRLIIGGMIDPDAERVFFLRGDGKTLIAHFNWFTPNPKYKPDFNNLEIIDYGQTIKLGTYEVAARTILLDLDPDYEVSPASSNFMK